MSVEYALLDDYRVVRVRDAAERLYIMLFGDRVGFTIFLGSLVFLALYWRVGVFITDNWTIANTMAAVADGHLYVDRIVYGPGPNTPGMHLVNERLYGRNYGHVVASLPFVWLLQGLASATDLRIAISGLWSVLVLGFVATLGALLGRRSTGVLLGSLVAFGAFASNVAFASPLPERWIYLMALQVNTMVATAFVGVVLYRMGTEIFDRRVGTFAGIAAVLATPLAFWGSLPKRHAVTALLLTLVLYSFYRSRKNVAREIRYRALAYAWVGLLAWVHAPEALVVFIALVLVDLPTARANDPRAIAAIAAAFVFALVPFLVTNQLIAGNPIEPPRLLPGYGGGEDVFLTEDGTGGTTGGGAEGGGAGNGASQLIPPAITTLLVDTIGTFSVFVSLFTRGTLVALTEPDRLYHTFVHSGYIERIAVDDGQQAINMALLESMPLLAALTAAAWPLRPGLPDPTACRRWLASPLGQTDLLVLTTTFLFTLIYLTRLPLHATVTVRYLVPIIPGLVYFLTRLSPVRAAIHRGGLVGVGAYIGTVLIGGQLLVLALLFLTPSLGEAIQLHAWIGLATALPLGGWALVATITDRDYARVGAVLLGVSAGATTVFLLLSGIDHFSYAGDFALPVMQRVSDALSLVG